MIIKNLKAKKNTRKKRTKKIRWCWCGDLNARVLYLEILLIFAIDLNNFFYIKYIIESNIINKT